VQATLCLAFAIPASGTLVFVDLDSTGAGFASDVGAEGVWHGVRGKLFSEILFVNCTPCQFKSGARSVSKTGVVIE
jgi:hypothetical protein